VLVGVLDIWMAKVMERKGSTGILRLYGGFRVIVTVPPTQRS
jgi:hypothetical protein